MNSLLLLSLFCLVLNIQFVHPLQCFQCKSSLSWSSCSQHVTVEECESEHPFEGHYACVSNRLNLTFAGGDQNSTTTVQIYATGCGWGDQDQTRRLFERLLPHQHANVSIEQWNRCSEDLCNSVAEYRNGEDDPDGPVQVTYVASGGRNHWKVNWVVMGGFLAFLVCRI
ncbi:uncharacterized protein LOC128093230 [Culex pipiens pallens]|uniref:uncharacterized protein LOC128093230 n=1 Tax=Culex pipiens pallens TaxID=42434 RepID=UPI0022AB0C7E|nr:uncharacterized protein LOC128093230 [Culex pipiens pallens]